MSQPMENKNRSAIGEPFVWLTSAGLIIGLLMVFLLLWVIVSNGVKAFWPRQVMQTTIIEADGTSTLWQGEIVKTQNRHDLGVKADPPAQEVQLYVGNRDAYGFSFKFFPLASVGDRQYPREIIKIEREEYGNAIGLPVQLKLGDGSIVPGDDASFPEKLTAEEDRIASLRHTIREIEKVKIGRINRAMKALREERNGLELKLGPDAVDASPQAADLAARKTSLDETYATLDTERLELHKGMSAAELTYRIASGENRTISTGKLMRHYYPNQLNLAQRVVHFLANFWRFLSEDPREANTEGGIFPAIFGTFVMTVLMSLAVTPLGVIAAIYLHEYARSGPFLTGVRIAVNNLAGVPSIVFGVFGLGFFVYIMGSHVDSLFYPNAEGPVFGAGGLMWASLTLALLTVPVVIVAAEEALSAVPRGAREGSLACGASKWQTIERVVLPAAAPGILTGIILAMARGAGEVAPLMLVGVVNTAETLPINGVFPYIHLEQKFMHLGFHIYSLGFQSPDSEAALPMVFATTFLLIVLVVVMNLTGIIVRERLRRKYAASTF